MAGIWQILDIPRDSDRDTIRRAYARKLRVTNPEDDPEGFKRLREAYEAALRQHEFALRWGDDADEGEEPEDDDEDESGVDLAAASAPITPVTILRPADDRHWDEPPAPIPGARPTDEDRWDRPPPPPAPEIDAMLAAREAELAQLRAAMAELEAGLRGPWRADDATLEQRLAAILASPMLGEIRVREDVEAWLAGLLAATIPHSDAILLQSIQAFGWSEHSHLHGFHPALRAVLTRLDEWRIIEGLNHHSHRYHAAWRSLTSPPGSWWIWRLRAFRPGMISGVEALLGDHGDVSPGLHHSFNAEAVERWRAFLAKPRLTLGMIALLPVTFLTLYWLGYALLGSEAIAPSYVIGGIALIGFALPLPATLYLARWRQRWHARWEHPRRLSDGWLAAYMLLAFAAAALPRGFWPVLVVVPAAAIGIWAYIVTPRAEAGPWHLGGGFATCVLAGIVGAFGVAELDPSEAFAAGMVFGLLIYFRIALWSAIRSVLSPLLARHGEWIILGSVAAGLAGAFGIVQLGALWGAGQPLYSVVMVALALLPLVGAPYRHAGPPRWIARSLLLIGFFWALTMTFADQPVSSVKTDTSVLHNATSEATKAPDLDTAMARLEERQPGFRQMREGNPALYARVRAATGDYYAHRVTLDQANATISTLVDDAYRRMLPDADGMMLVETLRIGLDRLIALRETSPAACVAHGSIDEAALPDALRKRQSAMFYNIISNPPATAAERARGDLLDYGKIERAVEAKLKVTPEQLSERIEGKHGPEAACDVLIAVDRAKLDQPSDDIAATLRKEYRRERNAGPAKKKRGDR